mmetsp:Transcript_34906/g.86670  ORF Transcript_34906/g.86670 Transcript_34906/m.86670 type:complete len:88 (-) Transcript_34906:2104-2367(-)
MSVATQTDRQTDREGGVWVWVAGVMSSHTRPTTHTPLPKVDSHVLCVERRMCVCRVCTLPDTHCSLSPTHTQSGAARRPACPNQTCG